MKYSIITFGCRVNQADSLAIEESLRAHGASSAAPEEADVVVVNTCSVTSSADQGARQAIRRVARANPSARVVVTGCYATRRPGEVAGLPGVVRVVPNEEKPRLLPLVRALTTAERFGDGEGSCGAAIEPGVAGRTAFTLRVQTGCAEPCAYCIIPATRGAPRSVPLDDVIRDVERVVAAGFKEIVLTGVHLGSYGRDLTPPISLADLLARLAGHASVTAPGVPPPLAPARGRGPAARPSGPSLGPQAIFRVSSLEPMDCTPDVVNLVATNSCFAAHFHLPLQHASNRVLAAMRRPYPIERYAALVDDIRARIPGAAIGSDVIVGFPGETDEEFERLATYLGSSPLTHVHVFPYSDRPGTAASGLAGAVPGTVIRERARRIREISARLTAGFRDREVGTVHRALTLEDGSLAVTGNYLKLRIPVGRPRNEWVRVRVASHHEGELLGG